MSGPVKEEPQQFAALAQRNSLEGVAVVLAGTRDDWRVELRVCATLPGRPLSFEPAALTLAPNMLREIGATLLGIADLHEVPLTNLPSPDQVEEDVRDAPEHLKELVRTIGAGKASFLVACSGGLPFRSIASHPVLLFVDDAASKGPADFNVDALTMALRRSSLVVVTVYWRVISHYNAAARRASAGDSVVIIETTREQARAWSMFIAAEVPDIEVLMPSPEAQVEESGGVH